MLSGDTIHDQSTVSIFMYPRQVVNDNFTLQPTKGVREKKIALTGSKGRESIAPLRENATEEAHDSSVSDNPVAKTLPVPVAAYKLIPTYSDEALDLNIEGEVVFSLMVGKDGRVREEKLIRGLGYGLDERALAVLRKYIFTPALDVHGHPLDLQIEYTFVFSLDS